jgi:hypothetical protein
MDRAFRQGYLDIAFPTDPFHSPPRLLLRALRVFFANIGLIATATLAVFLPGKFALQWIAWLFDVPKGGISAYLIQGAGDLLFSSLAIPAIVYGLIHYFETGRPAALRDCLRWGRRQWLRTLWTQVKVEITVTLWAALLIVPGFFAMVRLAFAPIVAAVEGSREPAILARSAALAQGRRWRIFFVLAPLMILDLVVPFLVLGRVEAATTSRALFALADCALAVTAQLTTVATLLMYLGTAQNRVTKLKPCRSKPKAS